MARVGDHVGEASGGRRPFGRDLAGYVGATSVAFIEAKFDAGLTGAQPVDYLRREYRLNRKRRDGPVAVGPKRVVILKVALNLLGSS